MRQRSIGVLILALGGLVVWAAHFALLYGAQATFCTVAPADASATGLRIAGLALTAVAAAALLLLAGRPRLHTWEGSGRGNVAETERARFLQQVSLGCAGLAMLAMAWAAVPLLLLPACSPAAV